MVAFPVSGKVRVYLLVRDAASDREPFPKRKAHCIPYALPRGMMPNEQGWGG